MHSQIQSNQTSLFTTAFTAGTQIVKPNANIISKGYNSAMQLRVQKGNIQMQADAFRFPDFDENPIRPTQKIEYVPYIPDK